MRPDAQDTDGYSLHCKDVPQLDPGALLALPAADAAFPAHLRDLLKWTTDAAPYRAAASANRVVSAMKPEHLRLQLERNKIALQPDPKGFCKVFLVPEHAKRRWRFIQHPRLANMLTAQDDKVTFTPFYERHNAVLRGRYAVDLDWAAFFDQFGLSDEVSPYFSFAVSGGAVYSMKVLPMGLKHSVSIAHTATMQLLNFGPSSYVEAYIDNVRLVSDDRDALIQDAATLLCRCAAAGVTVNEADVRPLATLRGAAQRAASRRLAEPLCRQQGDWLGERYDYAAKTVALADKTRSKVRRERGVSWLSSASTGNHERNRSDACLGATEHGACGRAHTR